MPNATRNIYQRLRDAIEECPPIAKDTTVGEGRFAYKAQTYDAAIRIIAPILTKHGIVTENRVLAVENGTYERPGDKIGFITHVTLEVTFVNADNPDERIVCSAIGTGMDTQDKAAGKAYTYARKYAVLHALMTTTGDNEEDRPDHEAQRRSSPKTRASTEGQQKAIYAKGKTVYGDGWDAKKNEVLGHFGYTSTKELTFEQASKWIDALAKKEEEAALNEMGV